MPKLYKVTYERVIKEERNIYANSTSEAIKMVRGARKRFWRWNRMKKKKGYIWVEGHERWMHGVYGMQKYSEVYVKGQWRKKSKKR